MRTVAGQVFLLQLVLVVLLVSVAVVALTLQARRDSLEEARDRSLVGAQTFAQAPGTVAAMESADPAALLQPPAEETRKNSGVDYVIAFSPAGIRWTHPDPDLIGKRVVGSYDEALAGKVHIATYDTPGVGRAVDAMVPVFDSAGEVVGLVSVGVTVENVNSRVMRQLPLLFGSGLGALALVSGGTALVSRRLRRQTRGLGAAELARMYEHHDAVLHAVREGVLIVGEEGRLVLANDEARRLFDLPRDAEGRRVTELELEPRMTDLLVSGQPATDEVRLAGDRLLAVNVRSTAPHGGPAGAVVTVRDTTELRSMAGRAEAARERLSLLYDAGVRVGTTLDVTRTAEELADIAVPRFADIVTVELLEPVLRGGDPEEGSPRMRRTAARGIGDTPLYPVGTLIPFVPSTPYVKSVTSGRSQLQTELRTAGDWQAQDPERARRVLDHGVHSLITVPLRARGTVLGLADFWRRETPGPFGPEDVSFAEELAARAAVAIDNARRYTRERTTTVTLQRSLLPRALPGQSALEVAHRYLPAQAGVGGDWFDVIPLPGARVALVVGDVVGHGLHAAATMGRLRTAVHTFSALDLPPDELLVHLDELVSRIDTDTDTDTDSAGSDTDSGAGITGITGATCLYAVYDPVTGRATMATAGHPGPALVLPDGTATYPGVPVAPPLGLGGAWPAETAEFGLPEGSHLVLYTDGLLESRDRDLGTGLELLRTTLAGHAGRTPEETCTAVLDAVLPTPPSDDVALLIATTRLLGPGQVAQWDVPRDPAAVGPVRSQCVRRLHSWGLTDLAPATELILSELITNAVRHGAEPINVRLIHDRTLICEVSDGSSVAPHLRQAGVTEEGGRGLFLVAQFADHWGTRYTHGGKIIWTEQTPHSQEHQPASGQGDDNGTPPSPSTEGRV
ncbi:SpoIIE family protein phosphatase [Streptomyces sp. URMC 129]|uniref:SpoIIE family protein phosphatase n=1 Tax=Streptomyces sp. URMC 129 TaxID=3423407 RepID=UPI003F1C2C81